MSIDPTPSPAFVVTQDANDADDAISALALVEFVAGRQPAARSVHLQRLRAEATLLPPGCAPTQSFRGRYLRTQLTSGDGWTLWSRRWSDGTAGVHVTARTLELAESILAAATDGAEEPAPEDLGVAVGFWHLSGTGGRRAERSVAVEPWSANRKNYTAGAVVALDDLMSRRAEELGGRLLLLYGPPGTGKTTAIRALAAAWREWCQVDCVLDPERLLNQPGYLMQVVLDGSDDDDGPKRWRLLVLEDCDDFVRAEVRGSGQALARLLNLTDGMAGQGLRVLMCVTTTEPLRHLHPAVMRPGRCFAQIEVGRLSRVEAADWLGTADGIGPDGATLAELLARRGDIASIQPTPDLVAPGQYL